MKNTLAIVLLTVLATALDAQVATPGTGLPEALFQLQEIDLHLHSGMERPVDLNAWLELARQDGRRVVALIDHLELYRKTPEEYRRWREESHFEAYYPTGPAGHRALMDDFANAVASRPDMLVFRAWEVDERELDSGIEAEPLKSAELIGFHVGPNNGGAPPDGRHLIRRARQLRELQRRFPVPMVLLHPFPMRAENVVNRAAKEGRPLHGVSADEFRFFHAGEQEELASVLKGSSVYVEIGRGTQGCFRLPACQEAMLADIRPLAAAGVQFTVSTDNHNVKAAKMPFRPETYCEELGVTPANTNTIIRELLALRARRSLTPR